MQSLRKNGILIYFLVLTVHCVCIYSGMETLRIITKLLLVPVLAGWLSAQGGRRIPGVVYAGLVFCFAGDVLLAGKGDLYFLSGMLCFIIAHICNSIYFVKLQDPRHSRLREAFAAAVVLILLSAVVLTVLNSTLGSFRIPVLVYMVIISIMAILAANTAASGAFRSIALRFFIPGAGLFVISDAILAINKFMAHQPMLDMVVMVTYAGALYCLARGFAGHAVRYKPAISPL
jgi:uncharacterized membrane protein YhhN